jgi:ABC-type transport system substrate-binding protein
MMKIFKIALVAMALALVLAACSPAAPATEAPAATEEMTEAPAATEEMTEAPAATEQMTEEAYAGMDVSGDCGAGSTLNEIKAVDRLTVEFTMCAPDPAFPSKAAFSAFGIQPSEWIESTGGTGDLLDHPIGTGPYMLDTWNRGDSVVFKRFDGYWGDSAKTETLVFRWSSESAARVLELQSGNVDGIDNPGPDDFATIEGDSDLQLIPRPALNIFYIGFTRTEAPFDNKMVRQAIAMGIDRQRIVDNFYPVGSEVASHFTPCAIPNGCVGDAWYDFDAAAAKQMLSDAGYPDGFDTKLYYRDVVRSYLPNVNQVAQDIQAQLAENLGINAEINVVESGEFIDKSTSGAYTDGIHLLGWGADYPHVTNFLDYHFNANQTQFGPAYEDIYTPLAAAAQIGDPAEAESLYVEANNAVRDEVPVIPVAHGGSATAYRADVEGAHSSPLGNENMSVMTPGDRDTFVWMQNAEPISLYCGDESDGESLRACEQVTESLLAYEVGGTAVIPSLATACEPNDDLTVWTCTLRDGVKFHDGSDLDANDVVASWATEWDASSPTHVGNTGAFDYMNNLFGLINTP